MSTDITDEEILALMDQQIDELMKEISLMELNNYEPSEDELNELKYIEEQELIIATLFLIFIMYNDFVD